MTFLAPLALIGMLLLLLPIVVHLFKPRKMRPMPFSSLRWLKLTDQRLSRRVQWHQWLLFLLRAGLILLLVVALARPLIGDLSEAKAIDRFIILDTSRSMARLVPDAPTPFERGVKLATDLATNVEPGERSALLLAGSSPRVLRPLGADTSRHLEDLQSAKPGLADTSLSASLPLVEALLSRQDDRPVEVIFVTDNLQQRWQQGEVQDFLKNVSRPIRVKVIDMGQRGGENAWIANARLFLFGADEDRWIRVEVGGIGDLSTPRSIRLTGITGVADDIQTLKLQPGQWTHANFKIPAGIPLQGEVAEFRLEPADALPSDDVYYLSLDTAWALQILLVEPEATGPDGRSAGLFLRTGLEALAGVTNQSLKVVSRSTSNVTAADFRQADVIMLAGVPELTDAVRESLESRVRAGAGLALFLGPRIQPKFYNEKLYRPHQSAEGLLPLSLRDAAPFLEGNPGVLTSVRWTHPLLASLQDPLLSDLARSHFHIHAAMEGTLAKNDAVLARFEDEVPAIVERPVGAGRVLFFNTSANDEWTDLPRRKSFVPLLDNILAHLDPAYLKRRFTVGEAVTLPLPDVLAGGDVTVVTPSGTKFKPLVTTVRGQRLMHLNDVSEAGAYRIEGLSGGQLTFVVNAGRGDSSLLPMDPKVLEEWWKPATFEIVTAETAVQSLAQPSHRWPLWPALVVLAGLLLAIETVYVHRLCPRANPSSAPSGIVRPVLTQ